MIQASLLGFPRSGRTTLLRALGRGTEAAGDVLVVDLPDPRLDRLARLFKPRKVTPVRLTFSDPPVALGSLRGALPPAIAEADLLVLVIRAFSDPTVPHPRGPVDPWRDLADARAELVLWDLAIIERRLSRIAETWGKVSPAEREKLSREREVLERAREVLDQGGLLTAGKFDREEDRVLRNFQLLTRKPWLIVFNIDEGLIPEIGAVEERIAAEYGPDGGVAVAARLEAELSRLTPAEQAEFRAAYGLPEGGIDRLLWRALRRSGRILFYTYKGDELRAWDVPAGADAVAAAGAVHTDMARGFIRAEVVHFDDLTRVGSIAEARRQGLLRLEGRHYTVADGDVITFLFHV
jgi:ribosome-binding ATPase YchF (GTP1/OBG family)